MYLILQDLSGEIARNLDSRNRNFDSVAILTLARNGIHTIIALELFTSEIYVMHFLLLRTVAIAILFNFVLVLLPNEICQPFGPRASAQGVDARAAEADRLLRLGVQQFLDNQLRESFQSNQEALRLYRELGNRSQQAEALVALGSISNALDDYSQALYFLNQALLIFRETKNRYGEAATLNNIATVHDNTAQYEQALNLYQQALSIYQENSDPRYEGFSLISTGRTYGNIGQIYYKLGQYQQALASYQLALNIFRELGVRQNESTTLSNIIRQDEGITLSNIGQAYIASGAYPQALENLQQALVIFTELKDSRGTGITLNNIGSIYQEFGQYQRAFGLYQQFLRATRSHGDLSGESMALNNMGLATSLAGEHEEALELYQQSLAIRTRIGDRRGQADTLTSIGVSYFNLERYQEALNFSEQALKINREIRNRSGERTSLSNIGSVYGRLNQDSQALSFYEQALAIEELNEPSREAVILTSIGLFLLKNNQAARAEEKLYAAAELLDSVRDSRLNDADKVALFETQLDTYEILQQVLIAQGKIKSALEVAERGRARPFAELVATRISQGQSTQIETDSFDLDRIRQIAQQQKATLVEYSVISTGVGDRTLYIWVIQPTGAIHFRSIPLSEPLSQLVTTSRESIGARSRANILVELTEAAQQQQQERERQSLQKLHQLLIQPIAQYLPSNPSDHVIFIPQGELFLVPFPALIDASGKYLIEQHTMLTAPSIQVLGLTHQQRQRQLSNRSATLQSNEMLIVGNPVMPKVWNPETSQYRQLSSLPGAEQEADDIASEFNTTPLMWDRASETTVVQRMPSARLIHLATHGLLEYGNPQDSGVRDFPGAIALAPDSRNDGLLTATEILQLNLNAELVVLSACDTGRGRITGDGVIGLSRSLITAGVPSIIVSLWAVPDAPTAELMTQFYRQLQRNPDKAQALRQAMLTTLHQHRNPRDWAAFTLIGESE